MQRDSPAKLRVQPFHGIRTSQANSLLELLRLDKVSQQLNKLVSFAFEQWSSLLEYHQLKGLILIDYEIIKHDN